jgi:hypothetical protein
MTRLSVEERVWDELAERCASDPSKALRLVMVSREDVRSSVLAALNVSAAGEDGELVREVETMRNIVLEYDSHDGSVNMDDNERNAIERAATRLSSMRGEIEELREALLGVRNYAENRSTMCPSARAVAERANAALRKGGEG